jgi:hypothetical protein
VARRIEAANHRIDAAVAALAPDVDRPPFGRNRGKAEMLRAEWLADTLEGIASGTSGSPQNNESGDQGGNTQGDGSDASGAVQDVLGGQIADAALPTDDDLAAELDARTLDDLKPLAEQLGVNPKQKKADLIAAIVAKVGED